ncbi:MAG: hypothetical protein LBT04_04030 [Prevotellaceae bacterium]|nr:hypothetical protein [Prevotellaceae bacterium]
MKRTLFTFAVVLFTTVAVVAQPRAIGGRLGYGVEASYQHGFGEANFLQLDAGLAGYGSAFQLTGTYNWIFATPEWGDYGKWEWFGGVGAGLGFGGGRFFAGVAGNIGLAFTFDFPLQLSVDYRPLLGPSFGDGNVSFNYIGVYSFGLGVRYAF